MKNRLLFIIVFLTSFGFAQEVDSTLVVIDSTVIDSVGLKFNKNSLQNTSAMVAFYERLYQLEQSKQTKANGIHYKSHQLI